MREVDDGDDISRLGKAVGIELYIAGVADEDARQVERALVAGNYLVVVGDLGVLVDLLQDKSALLIDLEVSADYAGILGNEGHGSDL